MGQALLVRSTLTDAMVDLGRRLVQRLDSEELVFSAAFWLFDEETHGWQLNLASRLRATIGPLTLYGTIHRHLGELGAEGVIADDMVSLIDERDELVRSLVKTFGAAKTVDGARIDGAVVGTARLPGCLLYRVKARQRIG